MPVLVDTNIVIDILTDDPEWADWSEDALSALESEGLAINPAIYAELCFGCDSVAEADSIVKQFGLTFLETPRLGLFRAARAFAAYRRAGGSRHFVLPDFFVGGHAEAASLPILTRDAARYRSYFPGVKLISPDGDSASWDS